PPSAAAVLVGVLVVVLVEVVDVVLDLRGLGVFGLLGPGLLGLLLLALLRLALLLGPLGVGRLVAVIAVVVGGPVVVLLDLGRRGEHRRRLGGHRRRPCALGFRRGFRGLVVPGL